MCRFFHVAAFGFSETAKVTFKGSVHVKHGVYKICRPFCHKKVNNSREEKEQTVRGKKARNVDSSFFKYFPNFFMQKLIENF